MRGGIATLECPAKDETKTEPVRHENAKLLFQNIEKEVSGSITEIRNYSEREATNARDRAFGALKCAGAFSWLLYLLSKSFNFIGDMMHILRMEAAPKPILRFGLIVELFAVFAARQL